MKYMRVRRRAAIAALVLFAGGTVYCAIEVMWRGYTHISMAVCGGICFYIMYLSEAAPRFRALPLPLRALAGAGIVTAAEFAAGYIVNIRLGLGVWDYSGLPLSLMGQVCLPYSALWFLLCLAAFPLCDLMCIYIFGG